MTLTEAVKYSVMVMAEDAEMRTFLRIGPEEAGYEVHDARDGDEVVERGRTRLFRVFLVDMASSKGTMARILFDLKTHFPDTPIIVVLRGHWINEHRFVAKSFGVQQFLRTPFSSNELASAVRMALSVSEKGLIP